MTAAQPSTTPATPGPFAHLGPIPEHEFSFHFLGGRPSLDFVATQGERWRRDFERLREPADLGRWAVEAELLGEPPAVPARTLAAARELREAIYRTAKLAGRGRPDPTDVELINSWAALPPLAPRLALDGRSAHLAAAANPAEALLSTLARDAIDLVTGPYAQRVRECGSDTCALLFVDTSRPGRRRWCSMEACGNRAKTKDYRKRKAAA
jgi:predicted RNA-binding Zn ribbon-like protein